MLGLALVALLAFGALSAGAASAAEAARWKVKGAYLGAGAVKTFTATSTSEVVLELGKPNSGIKVTAPAGECTESGEIVGSAEGSPGTKKNVVLTCKKMKAFYKGVEQTKCTVNSTGAEAGTVKTNSLKSTLVWLNPTGGAAGDLLEPTESGKPWATVEIYGPGCAIESELIPMGPVINEVLPVEEEAVTGTLKLPASAILNYYSNAGRVKQTISQLKIGATASTLSGTFSYSLSSKEAFGVFSAPECGATGSQSRWKIGGGFICPNESRALTAVSIKPLSFKNESLKFTLNMPECTETGNLVGPVGTVSGSKTKVILTCSGVNVEGSPSCTVRTGGTSAGTIKFNALRSTLAGKILEPESGTILFTPFFEGAGCPFTFELPFTGTLKDQVEPLGLEVKGLSTNLAGSNVLWGTNGMTVSGTMSTSPLAGGLIGVFPG